jgi:ABC-type branched-subunit amino acid transport system substrate-binding protein
VIGLLPRRGRPRRARMTTRRKAFLWVGAAIVMATAGFGVYRLVDFAANTTGTCMNNGPTVVTHQGASGECVGVTDGSYLFEPGSRDLISVEAAIRTEDQQVRDSGKQYASVIYLMPAAGGVEAEQTFVGQLQGAYTAQHYANRNDVQGETPQIQLLIASSGIGAGAYRAVDDLIKAYVASQHLVAVAGIPISLETTLQEVQDLTGAGIPVFASTPTSDLFDNIPGMIRVSPSNKQEIDALLTFIKPTAPTAFLIEDTNKADIYDTSISDEFQVGFPDRSHKVVAIETYDSAGEVNPNDPVGQEVSNQISQLGSDICVAKPSVVLFGGRSRDLAVLIADLAHRPCSMPVRIVTGDDAGDMPHSYSTRVIQGLDSEVTLYYAAEVNPAEWERSSGTLLLQGQNVFQQAKAGYTQFTQAFPAEFGGVSAIDSDNAMGYDATLTAISAIRLAKPQVPSALVSARGVWGELSRLQLSRTVFGASGPIVTSGFYTGQPFQGSNPVGKAIPILRLAAPGKITFVQLGQSTILAGS